jgi:exopolyphosphatase/guanosine-5'-triphosphate,3'-diphosphate pyrophosphatase
VAIDLANTSLTAAGIDIGSNTFRLLVTRVTPHGLVTLSKKLATVRLAHNLAPGGSLHPAAVSRGLKVLETFSSILAHHQPQYVKACGTAALRMAGDGHEFIEQARQRLGVPVKILSGREEALLTMIGAMAFQGELRYDSQLLVDVGGGSTELIYCQSDAVSGTEKSRPKPIIISLDLGVVALTEWFLRQTIISTPQRERMDAHIRRELSTALPAMKISSAIPRIIGTGGTATSMAAIDLGLAYYDEKKVQNHTLTRIAITRLWEKLAGLSAKERDLLPGLAEGRGEILPAGIKIYLILLELLAAPQMTVSDSGLLEGILLSGIRDNKIRCADFL